ncbi:MAG: hypothetical protein KA536_21055 [Saprospiraceae bacterium]|nr:hypothetical protein [Saprospiraceae bacterium]
MKNNLACIILTKPPILGLVKTRLAIKVGDDKATEMYKLLLEGTTNALIQNTICNKYVCTYGDVNHLSYFINLDINVIDTKENIDLNEKINISINFLSDKNSNFIFIPGDNPFLSCYYIFNNLIYITNEFLKEKKVILGQTNDGGIYLLAFPILYNKIFQNLPFSSPGLSKYIIETCLKENIEIRLLPEYEDIDTFEDINLALKRIKENEYNVSEELLEYMQLLTKSV